MLEDLELGTKFSLSDLERRKLLRLPSGFGGSNLEDMETAWNKIFLKSVDIEHKGKTLKLLCATASGSEVSASIRSDNQELLVRVSKALNQNMIEKSISDIYNEKIINI